jgi:phosphoribosyl-ATP pyrophosphohydrolase
MTTPGLTLDELLQAVAVIDDYLDSHRNPEYIEQPLANDWARVTKICEEAGEVWLALSKRTGENYRKGVCGSEEELLGELADCVSAALCGIQHRTKDIAATWAVVSSAFLKARDRINANAAADEITRLTEGWDEAGCAADGGTTP